MQQDEEVVVERVSLHPLTEDPVVLERLAGVPAGAGVLVDALGPEAWGDAEADFLVFAGFGFGLLVPGAREFLRLIGLDPEEGSLVEPELVAGLLVCQGVRLPEGVSVAELGGVEWA